MKKTAIAGKIPAKLKIFVRKETEVGQVWDDFPLVAKEFVKVKPAFATDIDNLKTQETAAHWASHPRYDRDLGAYVDEGSVVTEVDNKFSGLRIVTLEKRAEGGRAYKVVTKDGLYFDLREDVLLDIMLHSTIKHGLVEGNFVFATVGSQMKLVRVGSALHKLLEEATGRREKKNVGKADLVPGGLYRTKSGAHKLFVGLVDTTKFVLYSRLGSSGTPWRPVDPVKYWVKRSDSKKAMFFIDIPTPSSGSVEETLAFLSRSFMVNGDGYGPSVLYWGNIVSSHSCVELLYTCEGTSALVGKIREAALAVRAVMLAKDSSPTRYRNGETRDYRAAVSYSYLSHFTNMRPHGETGGVDEGTEKWFASTNTTPIEGTKLEVT